MIKLWSLRGHEPSYWPFSYGASKCLETLWWYDAVEQRFWHKIGTPFRVCYHQFWLAPTPLCYCRGSGGPLIHRKIPFQGDELASTYQKFWSVLGAKPGYQAFEPYPSWVIYKKLCRGRGEILDALTSDACGAECSLSALQVTSVYRSRFGEEGKPLAIWLGNAKFQFRVFGKIPKSKSHTHWGFVQLCASLPWPQSFQVKPSCLWRLDDPQRMLQWHFPMLLRSSTTEWSVGEFS